MKKGRGGKKRGRERKRGREGKVRQGDGRKGGPLEALQALGGH